jgi:hypothetical protein
VGLAEGFDVGAGGLEDSQAEESEHRHGCEVVEVRGVAAGGQECLELEMVQPEGG